jgi:hypothetical protein
MSKNDKPKSHLPNEFQVTDGYNYGLDGFQFDTEYGGAVLDRARLPETKGLSALPNDLVAINEGSELPSLEKSGSDDLLGDLSEMMGENSLAELGWLHGVQDPDRLPKNPVDRGIMELEQQWNVGNATNGIIPNRDKEIVDFELSLQRNDNSKKANEEMLTEIVHHAHRKSAMGYPIEDIIAECTTRMGGDISLIQDDLDMIKSEHGLAGNVFVYASAFPGIQNGKWKKLFKKLGCRYLVGGDKSLSSFTDMQIVDSVNWKQAFKHYAPRLKLEGRKFAKGLTAKETLRLAFLSHTSDLSPSLMAEIKPVEKKVVDSISRREAFDQFSKMERVEREIIDTTDRDTNKLRQKVRVQIAKWVKANLLTREQGIKLGKSSAEPRELLRFASTLVTKTSKVANYSGGDNTAIQSMVDRNIQAFERKQAKEFEQAQSMVDNHAQYIEDQINKWAKTGLITKSECKRIMSADVSDNEKLRIASACIAERMKRAHIVAVSKQKTASYSGEQNNTFGAMSERSFSATERMSARDKARYEEMVRAQLKFAKDQVGKWVEQNLLTNDQANTLIASARDGETLLRTASELIASVKVGDYQGKIETQHIEERRQVDVVGETRKANQSKLKKATTWIRKQMCEGMIGRNLTQMIGAKFSSVFLSEYDNEIKQVRKAHEGLSGHIYVDAEAYASETGTNGCEKGALIHRANKVACVKAMSRCSTCVFANRNASGDLVCQKYNKPLVDELPVENLSDYQSEMIRMANASDAEQTASLFAPTYDENEFSLDNSALNNFEYEDDTFEGNLDGVFFGGLEIE